MVEFGAAVADVAGEADARVERRARRADVGVGRFELVFGFADVRAVLQDGGGDAARQAQVGKGFFEVARSRQVELAHRFADEEREGVQRFLSGAFGFGRAAARAFDLGLYAAQIASGHQPRVKLEFGEAVAFLAAVQDFIRQFFLCFGDARLVVGFGNGGDDAEGGGVARFEGGEVAVQRLVVHGFDAAVEVEFETGAGEAKVMHGGDACLAGAGEVARGAVAGDAAVGGDGRQVVGLLDAVLCLGDFDVERGFFQVVVVGKRFFDEFLQLRVAEVFAPAGLGGGLAAGVALFVNGDFHPVLRQGGFGLLVARSEAASRQHEGERDGF